MPGYKGLVIVTGSSGFIGRAVCTAFLVVTWAVIAFGEVARPVRLLNIPMGLWITLSPWLLSGATDMSRWMDLIVGGMLIALSVRRGHVEERFGGWNRVLI